MDVEKKVDLVACAPTEEVLTAAELRSLFETKQNPKHYVGYEVSGLLHLGSLVVCGYKINDMLKAGVQCNAYFAHIHSWINNKLGGDLDKIKHAAKYYEEAFKFFCPGLKVIQADELYHNNDEYWYNVIKFSKKLTTTRATRALTIMGRSQKEKLELAQYFYPSMQAVDIKTSGVDIAHAGMDQRSVHVLAREVYPKLKWKKPVAVHNHLIAGLAEPPKVTGDEKVLASKMSKSKPWTCIFIHDTEKEITDKIGKAWCPPKVAEGNPILEISKYIIFHEQKSLRVERAAKFGGSVEFGSYEELEKAYSKADLHPQDLKKAVAVSLDKIIKPLREHFEKPKNLRLLDVYKDVKITR